MSDCWRYGDVLKLRQEFIHGRDPSTTRAARGMRAMMIDHERAVWLAGDIGYGRRSFSPDPKKWERAEKDDLPPDQAMFVNGPMDGRTYPVGMASVWQVMEMPAVPHSVYEEELSEPVTCIKHEYERCRCGCGRMIWRRDWT